MDAMMLGDSLRAELDESAGVIRSTGRHDPILKQSSVNMTCMFSPLLSQCRAATLPDECVAPWGKTSDFTLMPGMWVFADRSKGVMRRVNAKRMPGNFGDVEVYDCVNGLHRQTDIWFVGIVNTFTPADNEHARSDCSVTIAGSATGYNTSPVSLKAGQKFGFLITPYTVTDHGIVRPGIKIDGVSQCKYFPMTVPFDDISSPAMSLRAIELATEDGKNPGWQEDVQAFSEAWRKKREKMRFVTFNLPLEEGKNNMLFAEEDKMPIDYFLAWSMAFFADGTATEVYQLIEDSQMASAAVEEQSELAVSSKVSWAKVIDKGQAAAFKLVEIRKAQCLANHTSWVAGRSMGTVLTNAPPGAQMDVCLGYYNV